MDLQELSLEESGLLPPKNEPAEVVRTTEVEYIPTEEEEISLNDCLLP